MLKGLLGRVVGDANQREIRGLWPLAERINALEPEFQRKSDAELQAATDTLRQRLQAGESLESLLPEAFAAVREASVRTTGMRPFDVQLLGGVVLHQGKVAEMKTGEGKTLVATLPLYLNALTGKGCHLVTVNDYLAKRDTQWMGPIYHKLGLSVGVIQHDAAFLFDPNHPAEDDRFLNLRPVSRREAYGADIIYGTNNEFGFDYLRDNMVWDLSQKVQRELFYAIVDEVDNILIDEARTPLIISGPAEESTEHYVTFARLVPRLRPEEDYTVDEKLRAASLTEEGISKIEKWLNIGNLYSPEHYEMTAYLDQALRADLLYKRDRDYIVKDGQVIIVDEFTGRLMYGRRYSEGLHQAIEAKEGVPVQRESLTLATITFQNYFRMYQKLAGMTGTAATEAEEFDKIYKLDVVIIPTHKPMIRGDNPDLVYKTEQAKFRAAVGEIEELYGHGQPVLVGTVSIEKSEMLAEMLKRRGIPHQVLNAKQHEKEAQIIAQAGRSGTVTIATNMAGRGVDILLGGNPEGIAREDLRHKGVDLTQVTPEQWGEALAQAGTRCAEDREKVVTAGGLHVLGTERHEARRIDNQLRGRSGRQGDPGSSRFYVSLEDDLMKRFGGETVKGLMDRLGLEEDIPIEHNLVTKSIESAQVRVEGYNFDIRKHLLEYDEVINEQRKVIYGQRTKILTSDAHRDQILEIVSEELSGLVETYTAGDPEEWDLKGLLTAARTILPLAPGYTHREWQGLSAEEIEERLLREAERFYAEKERRLGTELMRQLERMVMLRTVDSLWVRHLTALDDLRQGVGLRAYGQRDPLVEFKHEAYAAFQHLTEGIKEGIGRTIFHAEVVRQPGARPMREVRPEVVGATAGAAGVAAGRPADRPVGRKPIASGPKLGRNDPCYCGSGKKYKHCHLKQDEAAAAAVGRR